MFEIKINNTSFLVNSKYSVLEACQYVGINIPKFCYYENLSIAGNCRMCLVEVGGAPKPVASCALPVSNNMAIFTESPAVKKARENVLEILLLNHPLDCPICDQGGECDLQDQVEIFGNNCSRFFIPKNTVEDKYYGNFIKTIMTRCIHCTRCVRFSEEISGVASFGTLSRGGMTEIGNYVNTIYNSEISGNVIDLCPVGALTSKVYAFKARPWELKSQETIDCTCGFGSKILVHTKEAEIVRVQPKIDDGMSYITDKVRFSFDAVINNRIKNIYVQEATKFKLANYEIISNLIKECVALNKKFIFVINDDLELTTMLYLKSLENSYIKIFTVSEMNSFNRKNEFTQVNCLKNFTTKIGRIVILFSTNLKIECALLNTKLRIRYLNFLTNIFSLGLNTSTESFTKFINIGISMILKNFEGKTNISSKLFLDTKSVDFIVGNSLKSRVKDIDALSSIIKKAYPTSTFFNVSNSSNSEGRKIAGIASLNKNYLNKVDNICFINLEDNIFLRKLFSTIKPKTLFWFNTHGSKLALESNIIIPTLSFYEEEQTYVNYNNISQTTQIIISSGLKSLKEYLSIFETGTQIKKTIKFNSINNKFIKNNNTDDKSKYLFNLLTKNRKITGINSYSLKFLFEDFFLDRIFTKNSTYLAKRSQDIKKQATSFF